jgi:diguanylate cyclase (GGDEF)-like protein/PAS domain S-box-containing protein
MGRTSDDPGLAARPAMRRSSVPWLAYALGPVVITLLVGMLAGMAIWTEYQRYRDRATVATHNVTRLVEARLADGFDKIDMYLQVLAVQHTERLRGAPTQVAGLRGLQLRSVPLLNLESVRVADAQGVVRYEDGAALGDGARVADADFFVRARDAGAGQGAMVVSGPYAATGGRPPHLVLARAVRDTGGDFLGVVYARLGAAQFENLFTGVELGPNGAASLRTQDLMLVHRHPYTADVRDAIGTSHVSRELRDAVAAEPVEGHYLASTAFDQLERNNVYRKVRNYPFYLIVGQATQDFLEGWRANAFLFLALAGVTVALTLFACFTQYRWSRRQIQAIYNRFEAMVQTSSDAVIGKTIGGIITNWNRGAQQIFGFTEAEMIGQPVTRLMPPERRGEEPGMLARVQRGERVEPFETVRMRKDGSLVDVSVAVSPILDSAGAIVGVTTIARDISRHKAMEAEIRAMAFNDPLTRLPNRRLLMDRLRQAQLASARQRTYFGVLFIDLDRFKQVNDTFGHDIGDQLLIEVSRRLQSSVRQHDTVARLGGDEFVVLLQELGREEKAAADHVNTVADKLLDAIERDYHLRGVRHQCSASIGIRLLLGSQDSAEQILMDADAAMYRVKHQRRAFTPFAFE